MGLAKRLRDAEAKARRLDYRIETETLHTVNWDYPPVYNVRLIDPREGTAWLVASFLSREDAVLWAEARVAQS